MEAAAVVAVVAPIAAVGLVRLWRGVATVCSAVHASARASEEAPSPRIVVHAGPGLSAAVLMLS